MGGGIKKNKNVSLRNDTTLFLREIRPIVLTMVITWSALDFNTRIGISYIGLIFGIFYVMISCNITVMFHEYLIKLSANVASWLGQGWCPTWKLPFDYNDKTSFIHSFVH